MERAINGAASAGMEATSSGILCQISHPLWTDGDGELGGGTGNWVAGVSPPAAHEYAQH